LGANCPGVYAKIRPRNSIGSAIRLAVREVLWLPITLAAVLGEYLFGIDNRLVFDDELLASGNLFARYGEWREVMPRLFSYSSFVWVRDLFGEGWAAQRLANLAVHLLVVLALWGFYRDLLRHVAPSGPAAGGAAEDAYPRSPALGMAVAFFALNPAAVYAVAYLIQRSILMATLFTVLGLWAFLRGLDSGRVAWHGLAVLCYVLAVGSKEHAVMAPLAALPLYIVAVRPSARRLAAIAGLGGLLMAGAAAFLLWKMGEIIGQPFDQFSRIYLGQLAGLGPDVERHAYPLSIVNQAWLFFAYGLRWLFPYAGWMSIDLRPPFPVELAGMPHILGLAGYLAVLAGGLLLVVRYRDWRALIGLSLLLPATLFMTEFATVWVQDPFVLYRSYLWAIGLPGLVFFLFHGISARILLPIGLLIGLLLVWQAVDRVHSLSTPERVWSDAIAKLPDDRRAVGRWFPYLNRGNLYLEQDRREEAMRDFRTSAALGDAGMGQVNVGALLFAEGRHTESLAALEEAQRQGYDRPNLYYQQGVALLALGRRAEARARLDAGLAKGPGAAERDEFLAMRARAALEMGDAAAAVADAKAVLAAHPGHKRASLTLGMAYVARQEHEAARELFTRLLERDQYAPLYYGRALAHLGLKRKAEALADIEAALRLDPRNPALQTWRARIAALPGR
jgi:tetratricopeptide (TPR) repeat protein